MKLVVGLGNPGRNTREPVTTSVSWSSASWPGSLAGGHVKPGFRARRPRRTPREKTLLLTPTTYMNLSGASVLAARDFYKIPNEDMLVVCDNLNLPCGRNCGSGRRDPRGTKRT